MLRPSAGRFTKENSRKPSGTMQRGKKADRSRKVLLPSTWPDNENYWKVIGHSVANHHQHHQRRSRPASLGRCFLRWRVRPIKPQVCQVCGRARFVKDTFLTSIVLISEQGGPNNVFIRSIERKHPFDRRQWQKGRRRRRRGATKKAD